MQAELALEREGQKEKELLQSQRRALAERIAILQSGRAEVQESIEGLGDLEERG